jgi:hypothetical protein
MNTLTLVIGSRQLRINAVLFDEHCTPSDLVSAQQRKIKLEAEKSYLRGHIERRRSEGRPVERDEQRIIDIDEEIRFISRWMLTAERSDVGRIKLDGSADFNLTPHNVRQLVDLFTFHIDDFNSQFFPFTEEQERVVTIPRHKLENCITTARQFIVSCAALFSDFAEQGYRFSDEEIKLFAELKKTIR